MILDCRLGWLLSSFCFHPLTPITVLWSHEGLGNPYFHWPLKPHLLLSFSNVSSLVPRRSRLSQTWTLQWAVTSSRETLPLFPRRRTDNGTRENAEGLGCIVQLLWDRVTWRLSRLCRFFLKPTISLLGFVLLTDKVYFLRSRRGESKLCLISFWSQRIRFHSTNLVWTGSKK